MELEALVVKLKSLGFSEEAILDVRQNGKPLQSVKIVCETRKNLLNAARVLGASRKKVIDNDCGGASGVNSPGSTRQGRDESQSRAGSSRSQTTPLPGMMTPQLLQQRAGQQQQLVSRGAAGGGGGKLTPHQFGLTPFQSKHVPSIMNNYTESWNL